MKSNQLTYESNFFICDISVLLGTTLFKCKCGNTKASLDLRLSNFVSFFFHQYDEDWFPSVCLDDIPFNAI